eukprot:1136181-Pelagomonas_calceolata.AAC.2
MHDLLTHVMSIVCAPLRSWQDWLRDSNMTIYGHPPTFDFDWERMNAEDLPLPQSWPFMLQPNLMCLTMCLELWGCFGYEARFVTVLNVFGLKLGLVVMLDGFSYEGWVPWYENLGYENPGCAYHGRKTRRLDTPLGVWEGCIPTRGGLCAT